MFICHSTELTSIFHASLRVFTFGCYLRTRHFTFDRVYARSRYFTSMSLRYSLPGWQFSLRMIHFALFNCVELVVVPNLHYINIMWYRFHFHLLSCFLSFLCIPSYYLLPSSCISYYVSVGCVVRINLLSWDACFIKRDDREGKKCPKCSELWVVHPGGSLE